MTSRKTFYEAIFKSALSETDKSIWYEFIDGISDRQVGQIYQAINDDPEALVILTDNLQKKFWALRSRDKQLMDSLVEQEQEILLDEL